MIPLQKLKSSYSKDRVEVDRWYDGRKVYRKVITENGNIPDIIPFEKFTLIMDVRLWVENQGGDQDWRPIPWTFNGDDLNWHGGFRFSKTNKNIINQIGSELKKATYWHLIIDYTID